MRVARKAKLKIHSRTEEKKFVKRLRLARWVLALARLVRGKPVSRLISRFCYFGPDPDDRLQVVAPYHHDLLMHLDVHSWVERKILCTGYFERWVDDFLTRCLKPGYVALDVGANIGCHTLVMASAVGQSGRVLAFEPNPRVFARLQANIRLNRFANVDAFPVALSHQKEQQTLFIPGAANCNQGLASMHRANLDAGCEEVPVVTLTVDEVVQQQKLQRVDLLKVDVEGHEWQVFLGARETLARFRPVLVFEFSERQWRNGGFTPADVEAFMAEQGYELFVMRRGSTTSIRYGVAEECDLLALPK